jgi:hypothetical protein
MNLQSGYRISPPPDANGTKNKAARKGGLSVSGRYRAVGNLVSSSGSRGIKYREVACPAPQNLPTHS